MNKRQVNHLCSIGRKAVLAVYEDLKEYDYGLIRYNIYPTLTYFDMEFIKTPDYIPSNTTKVVLSKYIFKLKLEDDTITYLELVQ